MQDTTAQIQLFILLFDEAILRRTRSLRIGPRIQPKEGPSGFRSDGGPPLPDPPAHRPYPNPFNPATVIPFSVGRTPQRL